MMRFSVVAVHPRTGEDQVIVLEARDSADAERQVLSLGLTEIRGIYRAPPADALQQVAPIPSPLEAPLRAAVGMAGAWSTVFAVVAALAAVPGALSAIPAPNPLPLLLSAVVQWVLPAALVLIMSHQARRHRHRWATIGLLAVAAVVSACNLVDLLVHRHLIPNAKILFLFVSLIPLTGIMLGATEALVIIRRLHREQTYGFAVEPASTVKPMDRA